MEKLVTLTDQLNAHNDRWLFIATLVVFAFSAFLAFRWLVAKHELLVREQRADQLQYTNNLIKLTNEQTKTTEILSSVLQQNTAAIHSNTAILVRHQAYLDRHGSS